MQQIKLFQSSHMVGQSNPGRCEESYQICEGLPYTGCIQDCQQTSQPQLKPDSQDLQARTSSHNIPLYGQHQTSQGAFTSSSENGHHHQGFRDITHVPIDSHAAHGHWKGVSLLHRLSGDSLDAQTQFKSEYNANNARRTAIACKSCRIQKVKCSGDRPCKICEGRGIECVYLPTPPKTTLEVRLERMEHCLQELLARGQTAEQLNLDLLPGNRISSRSPNNPGASMAGQIRQSGEQEVRENEEDSVLPSSELATSNSHRTIAFGILSWSPLRHIIGDVVHDDETAGTVSRLVNLYIKEIHPVYPILSLAQLGMLTRDFLGTDVANAMPEPKHFEPAGHKRKRSASEASQLSIERALFLLILALASKFDAAPQSPQSVQKPCLGACLDQNTLFEPGLKYFAAATDIMARHTSGTSLCHVQAFLLRGIYHGQWAQDSARARSLLEAANALQTFLLHKYPQFETSGWDNAVCIAFWTQRLLESESVTEIECLASNIRTWEPCVPMPDVHRAEERLVNNEHLLGLVAQLELRKHLNRAYAELNQQVLREINTPELDFAFSNLRSTITDLNHCAWEIYKKYQPDEAKSKSPWAIRVKAKFVAAVAFAARHFLMMILNQKDQEIRMSAEVRFFGKYCITLMEKSAIASSSVKDDRHLTHGHCANIIVLLVACSNATVKHLINPKSLRDLVNRALVSLKRWPPSVLEQKYVKSLEAMAYQAGLLESHKLL